MLNYTNRSEYKGLWGLYTHAERNPLGHSPEASVRIDALARMRGSRSVLHSDAVATLYAPAPLTLSHVLDACAYADFCRHVDNEVLLVDIQTSAPNMPELNECHRVMTVSGMAIDADDLVMGRKHASRRRFVLFSPFGMTKWRLLCNMHENTVDTPINMYALDIPPPRIEVVHARLLRKTGLVAAPIRLKDLAGFPLRLLLRDWEQDVQKLKDHVFMSDLYQWIKTTTVRRADSPSERSDRDDAMAKFHLLHDETDDDDGRRYRSVLGVERVFNHRWFIGPDEPGPNRLVIQTQLTTPGQSDSSDPVAVHIRVRFTDAVLEALFSPVDAENQHLTEDQAYPSDNALIGTVLSVTIRVQTIRQQLLAALGETATYAGVIFNDELVRVGAPGYEPRASAAALGRLDRAEQAFRDLYQSMSIYYRSSNRPLAYTYT